MIEYLFLTWDVSCEKKAKILLTFSQSTNIFVTWRRRRHSSSEFGRVLYHDLYSWYVNDKAVIKFSLNELWSEKDNGDDRCLRIHVFRKQCDVNYGINLIDIPDAKGDSVSKSSKDITFQMKEDSWETVA
jgi:hypothetical protein